MILLASGSEVATLVDGAEKLKTDGVKVRVVSVPSEGLFRDQSKEYQQSVLPCGVPKFGLTSGLPVTLAGLVGCDGEIAGLDHFGYSAPAGVLDQGVRFLGREGIRESEGHAGQEIAVRREMSAGGRALSRGRPPVVSDIRAGSCRRVAARVLLPCCPAPEFVLPYGNIYTSAVPAFEFPMFPVFA